MKQERTTKERSRAQLEYVKVLQKKYGPRRRERDEDFFDDEHQPRDLIKESRMDAHFKKEFNKQVVFLNRHDRGNKFSGLLGLLKRSKVIPETEPAEPKPLDRKERRLLFKARQKGLEQKICKHFQGDSGPLAITEGLEKMGDQRRSNKIHIEELMRLRQQNLESSYFDTTLNFIKLQGTDFGLPLSRFVKEQMHFEEAKVIEEQLKTGVLAMESIKERPNENVRRYWQDKVTSIKAIIKCNQHKIAIPQILKFKDAHELMMDEIREQLNEEKEKMALARKMPQAAIAARTKELNKVSSPTKKQAKLLPGAGGDSLNSLSLNYSLLADPQQHPVEKSSVSKTKAVNLIKRPTTTAPRTRLQRATSISAHKHAWRAPKQASQKKLQQDFLTVETMQSPRTTQPNNKLEIAGLTNAIEERKVQKERAERTDESFQSLNSLSFTTRQWLNLDLKEAVVMPKYNAKKQYDLCFAAEKKRKQTLEIPKILSEANQKEPYLPTVAHLERASPFRIVSLSKHSPERDVTTMQVVKDGEALLDQEVSQFEGFAGLKSEGDKAALSKAESNPHLFSHADSRLLKINSTLLVSPAPLAPNVGSAQQSAASANASKPQYRALQLSTIPLDGKLVGPYRSHNQVPSSKREQRGKRREKQVFYNVSLKLQNQQYGTLVVNNQTPADFRTISISTGSNKSGTKRSDMQPKEVNLPEQPDQMKIGPQVREFAELEMRKEVAANNVKSSREFVISDKKKNVSSVDLSAGLEYYNQHSKRGAKSGIFCLANSGVHTSLSMISRDDSGESPKVAKIIGKDASNRNPVNRDIMLAKSINKGLTKKQKNISRSVARESRLKLPPRNLSSFANASQENLEKIPEQKKELPERKINIETSHPTTAANLQPSQAYNLPSSTTRNDAPERQRLTQETLYINKTNGLALGDAEIFKTVAENQVATGFLHYETNSSKSTISRHSARDKSSQQRKKQRSLQHRPVSSVLRRSKRQLVGEDVWFQKVAPSTVSSKSKSQGKTHPEIQESNTSFSSNPSRLHGSKLENDSRIRVVSKAIVLNRRHQKLDRERAHGPLKESVNQKVVSFEKRMQKGWKIGMNQQDAYITLNEVVDTQRRSQSSEANIAQRNSSKLSNSHSERLEHTKEQLPCEFGLSTSKQQNFSRGNTPNAGSPVHFTKQQKQYVILQNPRMFAKGFTQAGTPELQTNSSQSLDMRLKVTVIPSFRNRASAGPRDSRRLVLGESQQKQNQSASQGNSRKSLKGDDSGKLQRLQKQEKMMVEMLGNTLLQVELRHSSDQTQHLGEQDETVDEFLGKTVQTFASDQEAGSADPMTDEPPLTATPRRAEKKAFIRRGHKIVKKLATRASRGKQKNRLLLREPAIEQKSTSQKRKRDLHLQSFDGGQKIIFGQFYAARFDKQPEFAQNFHKRRYMNIQDDKKDPQTQSQSFDALVSRGSIPSGHQRQVAQSKLQSLRPVDKCSQIALYKQGHTYYTNMSKADNRSVSNDLADVVSSRKTSSLTLARPVTAKPSIFRRTSASCSLNNATVSATHEIVKGSQVDSNVYQDRDGTQVDQAEVSLTASDGQVRRAKTKTSLTDSREHRFASLRVNNLSMDSSLKVETLKHELREKNQVMSQQIRGITKMGGFRRPSASSFYQIRKGGGLSKKFGAKDKKANEAIPLCSASRGSSALKRTALPPEPENSINVAFVELSDRKEECQVLSSNEVL